MIQFSTQIVFLMSPNEPGKFLVTLGFKRKEQTLKKKKEQLIFYNP